MKTIKNKLGIWNKEIMWPVIMKQTTKAAGLTEAEGKRLSTSLAAQVVAATAYISGCNDPDRIAVSHLTTFIGAVRCPELFGHRNGESLSNRLLAGNYYPGGDPVAVKAGMLILELLSLNDHKHDFKDDLVNSKENPLVSHINYDEAREKIRKEYVQLSKTMQIAFDNYFILSGPGTWI